MEEVPREEEAQVPPTCDQTSNSGYLRVDEFTKSHFQQILKGAEINGFKLSALRQEEFWTYMEITDGKTVYTSIYVICSICSQILSDTGGQTSRHKRNCLAKKRRLEGDEEECCEGETEKDSLTRIIATFAISSGVSIYSCESEPFRKLVQSLVNHRLDKPLSVEDLMIPKRKAIRSDMKIVMDEKIAEMREVMQPEVISKFISFSADVGKVYEDMFAFKGSFVVVDFDDNKNKEWKMVVLPLAIKVCSGLSKNNEMVIQFIKDELENYSITDINLKDFVLVGDGASYMRKAGNEGFLHYVRCSSHLAQVMSQRVLNPYADSILPDDVVQHLAEQQKIVDMCNIISQKIIGRPSLSSSLPHQVFVKVETRWLSNLKVVRGISQNIDHLLGKKKFFDPKVSDIIDELSSQKSRDMMAAFIDVMEEFEGLCLYSQSDDITMHLILPVMTEMLTKFKNQSESQQDQYLALLSNSAFESVMINFDDVGEIHCLAHILNPLRDPDVQISLDSLGIDINIQSKATDYLKKIADVLDIESPAKPISPNINKKMKGIVGKCLRPNFRVDSVFSEFAQFQTINTKLPIEKFWPSNEGNYPKLYNVARKILGCVSSEASTERTFSLIKQVYRKNRRRLEIPFLEKLLVCYEYGKSDYNQQ